MVQDMTRKHGKTWNDNKQEIIKVSSEALKFKPSIKIHKFDSSFRNKIIDVFLHLFT